MADGHFFRSAFPETASTKRKLRADEEEEDDNFQPTSRKHPQPSNRRIRRDDDDEETAAGDIPLTGDEIPLGSLSSRSGIKHRNIKRQHAAVLTTIMHKCLLDADYVRGGRAFGLLLRLDMMGQKIDLRKNGMWGIGAEVLLRKDAATVGTEHMWFSQDGFRAARAYYDRLILQYPYRKNNPHLVSELHFNLAMFGVWIFEVQDRCQCAMRALEADQDAAEILDNLGQEVLDEEAEQGLDVEEQVRIWELKQAQEIEGRMERLTVGPPFDKDAQLLRLSGMVSLWIADLLAMLARSEAEVADSREKSATKYRQAKENGASIWKVAEDAARSHEGGAQDD